MLTIDPITLSRVAELTEQLVAELDLATSRFRPDSGLSRITAAAVDDDVLLVVSELLASRGMRELPSVPSQARWAGISATGERAAY